MNLFYKAGRNTGRLLRWLGQPKLFWRCAAGIIGCLVISIVVKMALSLEWVSFVRCLGLFLQWLGLASVALGIAETRKLFGKPNLWARFLGWLKAFPFFRRSVILLTGVSNFSAATCSARGQVISHAGPGASLEERLAVAERNINHLRDDLRASENLASERIQQLQLSIDERTSSLSEADTRTMNRLESFSVGGIDLEFTGLRKSEIITCAKA
jgi:hypothetical protein